LFNRVRVRLTLLTVCISLVLYMVSSAAVFAIVKGVVVRSIDLHLTQMASRIVTDPETALPTVLAPGSGMYATVVRDGQFLSNAPATMQRHLNKFSAKSSSHVRHFSFESASGNAYRGIYIALPTEQGRSQNYIALLIDDAREMNILHRLWNIFIFVGLGGTLLAAVAGFFLAERMLRPVRLAWQRQLEFAANASHELRTPLAVIQANLGVVMEHTDESVLDNLEWLNNAHSESRRLTRLVQDLLTLARYDSEKSPIVLDPVDLSALVNHVRDLYEGIATNCGIRLLCDSEAAVMVRGDADRLHQLLVILLDNACKFTPKHGTIQVTLVRQKNNMALEIVDSGRGVPAEDLPHVFERFYTGDVSRSREDSRSTGLGLAIAKWIVEAHQGKIALSSPGVDKGTTVRVELPVLIQ